MAAWSGFSDADLRAIKGETKNVADGGPPVAQNHSQAASSRGKPISRRLLYNPKLTQPVAHEAMLSKPKPKPPTQSELNNNSARQRADATKTDTTGPGVTKASTNLSASEQGDKTAASGEGIREQEEAAEVEQKQDKDLSEEDILSREIGNLDVFRKHQKKIEDMNIKRKVELAVAIQKRQRQAKAETSKLTAIQRELAKLDHMVNNDVSMIRDKIEESSREFLEAQKRYDRTEKEYVEAKMDYQKKQEIKETLTDHLYAIIHQNEVRKAKKLGELMDKLNMEDQEAENELSQIASLEIPQITMINPVTHLRPRKHSHTEGDKQGDQGVEASAPTSSEVADKETAGGDVISADAAPAEPSEGAVTTQPAASQESSPAVTDQGSENVESCVSETVTVVNKPASVEAGGAGDSLIENAAPS